MLADKHFHRMLSLERQRSERSRKPLLLMLLDMGNGLRSDNNNKALDKILSALSLSTRETDVTGWYQNNSIVGVMFTEFGVEDRNAILSTMMTRVSETLRNNLSSQQFGLISISFHLFPEEWNHDIPQRPTDPDAPVYAPQKPKPHLRSGGATAVPEAEDAKQVSPDNSFIPVARLSIGDSSAPGQ